MREINVATSRRFLSRLGTSAICSHAPHLARQQARSFRLAAVASAIAAMIGNVALAGSSPDLIAGVTTVAAGAILAMLVDTMIPEATEATHDYSGLIAAVGFLIAFVLTKSA